jgi:hypothetical protein
MLTEQRYDDQSQNNIKITLHDENISEASHTGSMICISFLQLL